MGKTSLVLRYCKDEFNDRHLTTIQASFFTKRITVGQARVKLAVWDTAGQERYAALGPIYYRDANGALLVYDITDRQSFDRVKQWVSGEREEKRREEKLRNTFQLMCPYLLTFLFSLYRLRS